MPRHKKKKWINKKNAVTFHLVHRSQQDPLVTDETAPQRVLLPVTPAANKDKQKKNKEEQKKYGIYFDDDYDYLQHLREAGTGVSHWEKAPEKPVKEANITLPSSVFASEVEEDIGLLNRAPPQSGLNLDLDPDVVAAMDEDFDFDDPDNQLDDDFVLKANASGDECEEKEYDSGEENYEDISEEESEDEYGIDQEGSDYYNDVDSLGGRSDDFDKEEAKSRFTEFSMTSSVVPRNDQLTLLDDRFEKMFAEYDESEIGPLDSEEIEGDISPEADLVQQLVNKTETDTTSTMLARIKTGLDFLSYGDEDTTLLDSEDEEHCEGERLLQVQDQRQRWDCESILSTYSNIYNHPRLITEPKVDKIKVSSRTGLPVKENKLTARNLAGLSEDGPKSKGPGSMLSALSTLSLRDKNETPEEKKKRKEALRVIRRERQVEKKMNRRAFTEEQKNQEKQLHNARVTKIAVHF